MLKAFKMCTHLCGPVGWPASVGWSAQGNLVGRGVSYIVTPLSRYVGAVARSAKQMSKSKVRRKEVEEGKITKDAEKLLPFIPIGFRQLPPTTLVRSTAITV